MKKSKYSYLLIFEHDNAEHTAYIGWLSNESYDSLFINKRQDESRKRRICSFL